MCRIQRPRILGHRILGKGRYLIRIEVTRRRKIPDQYGGVALSLSQKSVYFIVEVHFHLYLATEHTEIFENRLQGTALSATSTEIPVKRSSENLCVLCGYGFRSPFTERFKTKYLAAHPKPSARQTTSRRLNLVSTPFPINIV